METKQSVIQCDLTGAITTADKLGGWLVISAPEMRKQLHFSPDSFREYNVGDLAACVYRALDEFNEGKAKRAAAREAKTKSSGK